MCTCVRIYIKINSLFRWLWSKSGRVTISLWANLGVFALSETKDKERKEMTAGNNKNSIKKTRNKKEQKKKPNNKHTGSHFLWNFTCLEPLMDPRVLRSEFAGTEYHSGLLATWPSARKGKHTHTHTHTHTSLRDTPHLQPPHLYPATAGASDHRSCCPTLLRLGKISTVSLRAVSDADPPDPRTNPATEIKQPSLSVARVCCCLVLLWTLNPVKVDWVVSGKKKKKKKKQITGEQTSSEKVNLKCSSAVNRRKQATNWLLQGGTWQMNADSRAAHFVLVHYSPLYNECSKTTTCCSVYEFVHPQLSCYKRTTSLVMDQPEYLFISSFSSHMCELCRCEAQTLHNLLLQTGSCWWPLSCAGTCILRPGSHTSRLEPLRLCLFLLLPLNSNRLFSPPKKSIAIDFSALSGVESKEGDKRR